MKHFPLKLHTIFKIIPIVIVVIVIIYICFMFWVALGGDEVFHPREELTISRNIRYEAATFDDLSVHYFLIGEVRDIKVIFLPGWGGSYNPTPYQGIVTAFESHQVPSLVLELPGMAGSDTPLRPWSNEDYADFLHQFVIQTGISKPIIAGQSFGGSVAATYAKKYPNDISRLVLIDSSTGNKPLVKKIMVKALGNAFVSLLGSSRIPLPMKQSAASNMLKLPDDLLVTETIVTLTQRGKIMGQTFMNTHSEDQLTLLSAIQVPTLFVWGEQDLMIPFSEAKLMHQQMPQSQLVSLPGGHEVIFRTPKKTVELIVQHLY